MQAVIEIQIVAKRLVFFVLNPQIERTTRNKKETNGSNHAMAGSPIRYDSIKPKSSPKAAHMTIA